LKYVVHFIRLLICFHFHLQRLCPVQDVPTNLSRQAAVKQVLKKCNVDDKIVLFELV